MTLMSSRSDPENFSTYFDTKHLSKDLRDRSLRGGAITMVSQALRFSLQIISTIILARLLTPNDYGLIAMVTAISGFIEMFMDMGLSTSTIQKAEINHAQVSNLFWINVAVSLAFTVILVTCAPVISWFYDESRLFGITVALAGTFILSGLTVQHIALLRRQMRFTTVAMILILSMGCSIFVGIVMAWFGTGYWALVGMSITLQSGYVVFSWSFCKWRPGLPDRQTSVWAMLKFGGHITGFSVVNYFARNFDSILLGRFYGAGALGLYSRAYSIMMLPINQIRRPMENVAIPALSSIQKDPIRYKRYYVKLITIISFISMPLMVFLFVFAKEIISILLGSKWIGASGIFKILCINAFIQPVSTTWGLVLISLGQSRKYLIWGIINSIIIVLSFVLGLPWGALGVAKAYTIATYLLLMPTFWYCFQDTPILIADLFTAIGGPAIASIIMGYVIYLIQPYLLMTTSEIMMIGYSIICGLVTYLLVLFLLPGGRPLLRELYSFRSLLLQKTFNHG